MPWSSPDVDRIAATDEIDIAPETPHGGLRRWVTIWVVRVDDEIVIRSYTGSGGRWYRAARASGRGRVRVGDRVDAVAFEPATDLDAGRVDAAYRSKYGRSSYVDTMLNPTAAATTLRLVPDHKEQP